MLVPTRLLIGSIGVVLVACRSEQTVAVTRPEVKQWTVAREGLEQPSPEAPSSEQQFRAAPDGGAWCNTGFVSPTVFSYDRDGNMTVRGKKGRGPGEFEFVARIGFRGDTTWVTDVGNDRITYFDKSGKVVGAVSPIGIVGSLPDEKGGLALEAFLPDGSLLVRSWRNEIHWASGGPPLILFRFPRTKLGTLRPLPSVERVDSTIFSRPTLILKAKNMVRTLFQPWSDTDLQEIAPNGTIIVNVTRVPAQSNQAKTFHLRIRDGQKVITDTSIAYDPVLITDSLLTDAWKATRADLGKTIELWPSETAAQHDFEKAVYRPPHLPPVRALLVGNDSTIWLERPSLSSNALWEVYDLHARLLGRFEVPRAFHGLTASGTSIWGKELNEDGAWEIVRYRLTGR
jgi:hypothetical protein